MFDIFYTGSKPNIAPFEKSCDNEEDARGQAKTSFFWFIDQTRVDLPLIGIELFDFGWNPVPWESEQTHIFPFDSFKIKFCSTAHTMQIENWHDWTFSSTNCKKIGNWLIPEEIDETKIDLSWTPPIKNLPHIYHFGSQFQKSSGLVYCTPCATSKCYLDTIPVLPQFNERMALKPVDMFFIDMNNKLADQRYAELKSRYPHLQRLRFINGWIETIKRCTSLTCTQKFWVISSENIYTDFDFLWHADSRNSYMTHIFASQWQKWSDTFLINKDEFIRHATWAKTLEEFPNLHFVKDQKVVCPDDIYDIYFIDHANTESAAVLEKMKKRYPEVKVTRFADSYLATLRRIVSTATTEYIWVTNSICDYNRFDFTWQPEPWQDKMLHVFRSNEQKFGDTFYVHVPSFKEQMNGIELLDWYKTVNYCDEQVVTRLRPPTVTYDADSLPDAVKNYVFTSPFAIFAHKDVPVASIKVTPSIWRKKDRAIHTLTKSGSVTLVPRDAKPHVTTQLYDYPYIMPHSEQFLQEPSLDIIYISNGEPNAEEWLKQVTDCAAKVGKSVTWINGVNGRDNAIKAAAMASTTPWFFAVFAKLEINAEFDWMWQPDYLQELKHYIFHAKNPVNGLEYGHQAVVAYNKRLVLETDKYGLDFTMSKKVDVLPILSGIARYNISPIITWRTAFRECIKLLNATDSVSKERLNIWMTVANGENANWSLAGASDAKEFYDSVDGNMEELMKSFSWEWLDQVYCKKYGPI